MSEGGTLPTVELPEPGDPETVTATPVTRLDKPAPPAPSSGPGSVSPEYDEALHAEEAARARGWSLIVIALCASAISFSFILPARSEMQLVYRATLATLGIIAVWTYARARQESTYTRRVFHVFGWFSAFAQLPITYYIGVFSPAPLIVTLGITFFGLGIDRFHAIAIPVTATVGYFIMNALVTWNVIPDLGLVRGDVLPLTTKVFLLVNVPVIYGVALWFARVSRRSMIGAIDRSNQALLLANQRQVQLDEAREDLERALRAGAGREGVFSGSKAGAYTLAEVIGRGGMGDVYAADNTATEERVAVKVLRPDAAIKPGMLERFLREGQLASRLASPNIVKILDVGQLSPAVPYIVMELLHGEDLAAKLRRDPRMDPAAVVDLIQQTSRGLTEAHDAGIVHRDIKPQNLFESRSPDARAGTWKILDFGVSKLQGSSGTLTRQGLVGTPAYMSPEQAQGRDLDLRSDIFSLGAVAYRALAGTPPFRGKDPPALLFEIVYRHPAPPSHVASNLSHDFDRVLAIALAKDPNVRFASAVELADALAAAHAGQLSDALKRRGEHALAAQKRRS